MHEFETWHPLETPMGKAWGVGMFAPGDAQDIQWLCIMQDSGAYMTFNNSDVLARPNVTMHIREKDFGFKELAEQIAQASLREKHR